MTSISVHPLENQLPYMKFTQWDGYQTFRIGIGDFEVDFYVDDKSSEDWREQLAMLLDSANNAVVEVR